MDDSYWARFEKETDRVFQTHAGLKDHRYQSPWAMGALGDPHAGIWFIAENPSLTQLERIQDPDRRTPTKEAQWWSSRGDQLFREMLFKYGFRLGTIDSPGEWKCYLTNVIKEADYTHDWDVKTQQARYQAAEIWAGLLAWELKNSAPGLVVVMGAQTDKLLRRLVSTGKIELPRTEQMTHYAYLGQRAQGSLGPMHPQRIQAYEGEFLRIRDIFSAQA